MKILSLFLALTCLTLSTASAKPPKPHGGKPHINWEAKKAEFFKKFDKNKNGKIDPEERKVIAEEWKKKRGGKPPHGRKPRHHGKHESKRGKKPQRGQ